MISSTTIFGHFQRAGFVKELRIYVERHTHGHEMVLTYTVDGVPPLLGVLIFDAADGVSTLCDGLRNHIATQMEIPAYDLAFTSRGLL